MLYPLVHISMTLWFPTYITQRARLLKTICLKHKTSHWPQIAGPPGPQRVTGLWRCITCRTKEALQQCFLFTFLIQCYTTVNARRHFNKVFFIYIFVCFSSFYIFYTLPYSVITVVAKFDENKTNFAKKKSFSLPTNHVPNRTETVAQKPRYGPYRGLPVPLHP